MTLKREDGGEITSDTKVKFSLPQLVWICGSLVGGTLTVLTFVNSVRQGVEAVQRDVGELNGRLLAMDKVLKEQAGMIREQDSNTGKRVEIWSAWRWRVSYDIVALGKKTGVEVLTKEERQ